MNALQRRDVHEARGVAQQHDTSARAPLGERVEAALGDRLRTPLDHFSTGEQRAHQRVLLEPLQQQVHVERRVAVIEPHHEAQRDQIRLEGIHEAAAERVPRQRPPQRVDHAIERLLRLPQLLHAEGKDLRVLRRHALPLAPRLRQQTPRPLGERRDVGDKIVGRRATGRRLPLAIESGGRGSDTNDRRVAHQ